MTDQQRHLAASKDKVAKRYPSWAPELFAFLERDESTVCWANTWEHHLGALRVAPSAPISKQFGITLEIPILIASFEDRLEPRVLRHLETSTELRKSTTADRDIAIIVASNRSILEMVKDRKNFSYPILVLLTEDLAAGKYRNSTLRQAIANTVRSNNHFEYSNEIVEASDFFGRIDELDALTHLALSGQSVGIFGLRRAGKTSLLHRVRETLQDRGVSTAYVQLNALEDSIHLCESFVRSVAEVVRDQGGRVPANSEMLNSDFSVRSSPNPARRWIYEMDALLDELDRDLVVFIDESDRANEEFDESSDGNNEGRSRWEDRRLFNRTLQQLRGLIQIRNGRGGRNLSFISAGVAASIYSSATRFGSDNQLFGFASVRPLGPMSREEMRDMVRTLGKRSGMRFDGYEVFDSLFSEYGGHPHLTRQACSRLTEQVQQIPESTVPHHVTIADLDGIYTSSAENAPKHTALGVLASFERWYPDEASEIQEALAADRPLDAARATHAVQFGIFNADGTLRIGSLARSGKSELD